MTHHTHFAMILTLPILLAACTTVPPKADVAPPATMDACGAMAVQNYVGEVYSTATAGDLRVASGAGDMRVIFPGQAVTMDYRFDRINVLVAEDGTIERIHCG